jgi:rubrerythrin
LKYPNFSIIDKVKSNNDVEQILGIISNCIDYIYDEDAIYYRKDIDDVELAEFIENLTQKQFAKVQEFFETVPSMKKELDFKCNKCGYQEKIVVEGIQNFFA